MKSLLLFCCFLPLAAFAQTTVSVEASTDATDFSWETNSRKKRRERTLLSDLNLTGAWGGPTYNYSMTGDDWALVRGGFGGLEFSDEFFLGYGGWKSRDLFTTNDPVVIDGGEVATSEYDFSHSGFILGYAPGRNRAIHPRFTAILGPGKMRLTDDSVLSLNSENQEDRFFVGQVMGGLELNLLQWMRIGIEGGYRFAGSVNNDYVTARDISGAIVQIEARFGFSW